MGTYIVIVIGNAVILGIVRWFIVSERVQRLGGTTIPNIVGLGVCCAVIEIGFLLNAMDLGEFPSAWSKIPPFVFSILTAVPWGLTYIRLLGEMTEDTSARMAGSFVSVKEKVNLKAVYEHIKNGRMEEAEHELLFLHEEHPNAPEVIFVLASLVHGKPDYVAEEDYYRKITSEKSFPIEARINATQNLLELFEMTNVESHTMDTTKSELASLLREKDALFAPDKKLRTNRDEKFVTRTNLKPKEECQRDFFDALELRQARRMITRNEIDEAIPVMKSYIAEHPDSPRAYFELVSLFEQHSRSDDAVLWLQKMIGHFRDNDSVWGNAMLRLATIRENEEGDVSSSIYLLESVMERLKYANHGKIARLRLRELRLRESRD